MNTLKRFIKSFTRVQGVWYDYRVHCYVMNWRWLILLPVWILLWIPVLVLLLLPKVIAGIAELAGDALEILLHPVGRMIGSMLDWAVEPRAKEFEAARKAYERENYGVLRFVDGKLVVVRADKALAKEES